MSTEPYIEFNWVFFDKQTRKVGIKFNVLEIEKGGGREELVTLTFEAFSDLVDMTKLKQSLKKQIPCT